jgi:Sec-independent protein translocase protein TatA
LLVGYFVLGPSDLYKLVKEVGKFIQNIRTLGTDLSTTFENNMESTLQLNELRKAQRELNDAFSFRRSINVDADSDAFSVQAGSAQQAEAAAAVASSSSTATASTDPLAPPKKIRRRVRKMETVENEAAQVVWPDMTVATTTIPVGNIVPDLEMPELSPKTTSDEALSAEEVAEIEAEFDQYVALKPSLPTTSAFSGYDNGSSSSSSSWYDEQKASYNEQKAAQAASTSMEQGAQSRFQQQMSGNWNDQILGAGDKLEPIALVMNKIALLEQEKLAAIRRLEEEFAKRTELEEKFYKEQRKLLEESANEVQSAAFGVDAKTKI